MKKFLISLIILFSINCAFAVDLPKDINEYLNMPYIGLTYNQAMSQELPFLLIFASPRDLPSAIRFYSIGEMVYNEFKGQYNFCVVNTKINNDTTSLEKIFNVEKEPAMFIIDTKERTYTLIDKKYYKKNELREILTRFKNGTLFN
jgi:hypothetical protein